MTVLLLMLMGLHLLVWAYVLMRQTPERAPLTVALLLSSGITATYLLDHALTNEARAVGGAAFITILGIPMLRDLARHESTPARLSIWWGMGGLWIALLIIAGLVSDTFIAGEAEWLLTLLERPDISGVVMLMGLFTSGLLLIGLGLATFYATHIPEIANRAVFYVLNAALMVLGVLLATTGVLITAFLGLLILLVSVINTAYAVASYRIFDVRAGMISSLRTLIFVGVAGALIFATLYLAVSSELQSDTTEGLLILGGLALLVTVLYIPLRQGTDYLIRRFAMRSMPDASYATSEFSEAVSEALDLNKLLYLATATLNDVVLVRYSCLMLLNSTAHRDSIELLVLFPDENASRLRFSINVNGPIYQALGIRQVALSQFDIDYAPEFASTEAREREFFHDLGMRAYAPIILESTLVGVLAAGPKVDGSAFYMRDLELISTLARQTGVALRNARLVEDLQHLNKNMQSLNETLKSTNEQLNRMDAVKTDFVTIASHELRTPLAQIRGYTDIMEALNEQGMLDKDQTTTMVTNLRKATERMEELISAMLDVSQLDVDAMDLHFTGTSVESVLRMAIEPLSDAIRQRKLSLSARGLKGMPAVQADLQRLVQAFRNVIVNAIKFTPNGGKIDIVASLQESDLPNAPENILLKITDSGVGIDPQNLEMIFKKFFRAYDPSLHSTGTYKFLGAGPGLGLTIARGVIEAHGGKIWAESEGHDIENCPGTSFYILLPVSTPDTARRVLSFEGEETAAQAISRP
ncbi:MAG: hypothetical protein OHK0046_05630 [Anaerolineae bacterium]